jgi:hypothetical protein
LLTMDLTKLNSYLLADVNFVQKLEPSWLHWLITNRGKRIKLRLTKTFVKNWRLSIAEVNSTLQSRRRRSGKWTNMKLINLLANSLPIWSPVSYT